MINIKWHEFAVKKRHSHMSPPIGFLARDISVWIALKRYAINIFVGDHIIIPLEAMLPSPFEFFSCLRRLDSLGNF